MRTRLITAAVCIPALLVILVLLPTWATAWLFAILCARGAFELIYRTELVRHIRMVIYTAAMAFAVPLMCHYQANQGWSVLIMLLFLVMLFAELMMSHTKVQFDKVGYCLFAGLIFPYAFSSVVRIIDGKLGEYLVLLPFVLAFVPDSGAYFAGRFFGKHKLAPVISPKKTVEGAIGALITGILSTVIYLLILQIAFGFEVKYHFALIYGLLGSLAAIFGDLCFSVVKRQTGIKDFGRVLPGHGGVLDRFDSMIIVAPLIEALLILIPVLG